MNTLPFETVNGFADGPAFVDPDTGSPATTMMTAVTAMTAMIDLALFF